MWILKNLPIPGEITRSQITALLNIDITQQSSNNKSVVTTADQSEQESF